VKAATAPLDYEIRAKIRVVRDQALRRRLGFDRDRRAPVPVELEVCPRCGRLLRDPALPVSVSCPIVAPA
jgi:hypothetical protein